MAWEPASRRRWLSAARTPVGALILAGAWLAPLAVAVYAGHVRSYVFALDDWSDAAIARFYGVADMCRESLGGPRPLGYCYQELVHGLLGSRTHWHAALAVAVGVALSLALFAALRALGWTGLAAAGVSTLVFLFPAADSGRLWAEAGSIPLAAAVYLLGLLALVYALRAQGARAWLLTVAAGIAFAASPLLYEATAPAVAITCVAGLWLGRRQGATVVRGVVLTLAGAASLLIVATRNPGSNVGGALSLGDQPEHARVIAHEALSLFAEQVLPLGFLPTGLVVGLVGLLLVGAAIAMRRAADPERAASLRRWLSWVLFSAAGVVVAYAAFVPSSPYYHPASGGVGNRVNIFASVAWMTLAYALAALAAELALRGDRARTARRVAPLLACAALAVVYAIRLNTDLGAWREAAAQRFGVVQTLRRVLPHPRPGTTILTFGPAGEVAPGIPVFRASWDLNGAVQVIYNERSLSGWPVFQGVGVRCGAGSVALAGLGYLPSRHRAGYGQAVFVDMPAARTFTPRSPRDCRTLMSRLPLGKEVARPTP
jgi:hypothetical protein